jgi:hypothetical protein
MRPWSLPKSATWWRWKIAAITAGAFESICAGLSVPALCRGKSIVAIDVMCNPDRWRYLDGLSRLTGDGLEKTAIFAV